MKQLEASMGKPASYLWTRSSPRTTPWSLLKYTDSFCFKLLWSVSGKHCRDGGDFAAALRKQICKRGVLPNPINDLYRRSPLSM